MHPFLEINWCKYTRCTHAATALAICMKNTHSTLPFKKSTMTSNFKAFVDGFPFFELETHSVFVYVCGKNKKVNLRLTALQGPS